VKQRGPVKQTVKQKCVTRRCKIIGTEAFDRMVDRRCGNFIGIYSRETVERFLQNAFEEQLGNASV
jgi:hypothetical protein